MSAPVDQDLDIYDGANALAALFEKQGLPDLDAPTPQDGKAAAPAPPAAPEQDAQAEPPERSGDPKKTEPDPPADPDEAEAGAPIENIEHLAEAMGATPEEVLQSIKLKVKVGGQDREVTLADAQAGFLRQEDYTQKTMRLSEEKRQFETERDQAYVAYQQTSQQAMEALARAHKMVQAEMESETMRELELVNREDWGYLREKQRDRLQQIEQQAAQIMQQQQQYQAYESQRRQQRETQRVIAEHPDWDKDVHGARVTRAMKAHGFTDQEVATLTDGRIILAMHELGQLREENAKLRTQTSEQAAKAETVKKQVRRLPPLVKAGSSRKPSGGSGTKAEHFRRRVAQTGDVDDAAAAFEAMIRGM